MERKSDERLVKQHVLFDLDGTLTDSAPGITRCLAHAIHAAGGDAPSLEVLRASIGTPLREIFQSLLGDADPARIERAVASYVDRFDRFGIHENSLFPGVVEALEELRAAGCTLYVATAKGQGVAERVIERLALGSWFRAVFGARFDRGISSKTDVLRYALAAEAIPVSAAAMVGDRHHDIDAARALGVRAIGVSWGYGASAELGSAYAVADTPGMLVHLIGNAG